jgi:transcriptional regulator with XRE-family HTH domain
MMTPVSDNLRTILSELNMSQKDFAQSVGTTFVYINMVVNGKRNSISSQLALLIEEKYGYSANWLLHTKGTKKIYPFTSLKRFTKLKNLVTRLSPAQMSALFGFILSLEEKDRENNEKRNLKKQVHQSG